MSDQSIRPPACDGATLRQPRVWLAVVGVFAVTFVAVYCLRTSGEKPSTEPKQLSADDPVDRLILNAVSSTSRTEPENRLAESGSGKLHGASASQGVTQRNSGSTGVTTLGVPLQPDAIFAQASPAVVQVVIQDLQGGVIGTGSGFLVGTGLIATNYHVIKNAHAAHIILADKTRLSVAGAAAMDEEADIAIIKVRWRTGQSSTQALELAGDELPLIGKKVYAIGNPLGLANTLSDGLVSGHREIDRLTLLQTTAPLNPGSSGGPLLGADGRVVGVTTSGFKGGQNLNFAVPVSHVTRLLVRSDIESKLTPFSSLEERNELQKLQGIWTIVSLEMKGNKSSHESIKDWKLTIKGDEWTVSTPSRKTERRFMIDTSKNPKMLDLIKLDNKEAISPGIYNIEAETLTVCRTGFGGERPKQFMTAKDLGILAVWKRASR